MENENIIKSTCKELGLTYRELGEKIGYAEGAIRNSAATNKISEPMQKAIDLYLKTIELEDKLSDFTAITTLLKKHINH